MQGERERERERKRERERERLVPSLYKRKGGGRKKIMALAYKWETDGQTQRHTDKVRVQREAGAGGRSWVRDTVGYNRRLPLGILVRQRQALQSGGR